MQRKGVFYNNNSNSNDSINYSITSPSQIPLSSSSSSSSYENKNENKIDNGIHAIYPNPNTECIQCRQCIRKRPQMILVIPPCRHIQCMDCTYKHRSGDRCIECMMIYRYPGGNSPSKSTTLCCPPKNPPIAVFMEDEKDEKVSSKHKLLKHKKKPNDGINECDKCVETTTTTTSFPHVHFTSDKFLLQEKQSERGKSVGRTMHDMTTEESHSSDLDNESLGNVSDIVEFITYKDAKRKLEENVPLPFVLAPPNTKRRKKHQTQSASSKSLHSNARQNKNK